jgi:hypothetical protein
MVSAAAINFAEDSPPLFEFGERRGAARDGSFHRLAFR